MRKVWLLLGAEAAGWKRLRGNLAEVLPGKLIGGNVYKNRDHRLPEALDVFGTRRILIILEDTEITAV